MLVKIPSRNESVYTQTDREIDGQIDPNQYTKYSVNAWDNVYFNIVVTKWFYNEVPSQLLLK